MSSEQSPVEDYLDELLSHARGHPRDVRRLLAETEAHLYDDAEADQRAGVDRCTAQRRAVERLGPAAQLARRDDRAVRPSGLLRELAWRAVALAGIGCAAIGVSGMLTMVMTTVFGSTFVWADAPGARYSAGACAHFLAVQPHAHTCTAAALAESADDGQLQRFAVGLLGLLVLLALAAVRRRRDVARGGAQDWPVVPVVAATVAVTAFGGAAVFLLGHTVSSAVVASGAGMGQWLSGAIVSVLVAGYFVVALLRGLATSRALALSPAQAGRQPLR